MTPSESRFAALFEERLKETLKRGATGGVLDEAEFYACFGGGKRVRPHLVRLGAEAVGGEMPLDEVLELAAAVELVHSYSLVHDDLPAMDNDDYRRGRPTVHRQFGEANAILAGDALLTLAGVVLAEGAAKYGDRFARAATFIMRGAYAMAAGQAEDLRGAKTEEEFLSMYALKTGALIRAAFLAGATVAGGNRECMERAEEYADALGLAFQLADDLLDLGEQNSVAAVAGEGRVRELLAESTDRAVTAARGLASGDALADFALALARRKK